MTDTTQKVSHYELKFQNKSISKTPENSPVLTKEKSLKVRSIKKYLIKKFKIHTQNFGSKIILERTFLTQIPRVFFSATSVKKNSHETYFLKFF